MSYKFNSSITILRDPDGDYLVSFDRGVTSRYLTDQGIPVRPVGSEVLKDEHAVWQSGPGS